MKTILVLFAFCFGFMFGTAAFARSLPPSCPDGQVGTLRGTYGGETFYCTDGASCSSAYIAIWAPPSVVYAGSTNEAYRTYDLVSFDGWSFNKAQFTYSRTSTPQGLNTGSVQVNNSTSRTPTIYADCIDPPPPDPSDCSSDAHQPDKRFLATYPENKFELAGCIAGCVAVSQDVTTGTDHNYDVVARVVNPDGSTQALSKFTGAACSADDGLPEMVIDETAWTTHKSPDGLDVNPNPDNPTEFIVKDEVNNVEFAVPAFIPSGTDLEPNISPITDQTEIDVEESRNGDIKSASDIDNNESDFVIPADFVRVLEYHVITQSDLGELGNTVRVYSEHSDTYGTNTKSGDITATGLDNVSASDISGGGDVDLSGVTNGLNSIGEKLDTILSSGGEPVAVGGAVTVGTLITDNIAADEVRLEQLQTELSEKFNAYRQGLSGAVSLTAGSSSCPSFSFEIPFAGVVNADMCSPDMMPFWEILSALVLFFSGAVSISIVFRS